ncbi:MAG: imidazolonepropionase [Planctomycetota bacterium]
MSERVERLIENCAAIFGANLVDASVAIADGRVVAVGAAREIAGAYRAAERIDGAGKLLTPGFVDSHTHIVFAGDRSDEFVRRCQGVSYQQIAAAGGGIRATVRATRQASEEQLYELALPRLIRMLSLGTTTIEIKSGYGLNLETELRMLRVIRRLGEELPVTVVATFMGAHEIPDEYRTDRNGYIDFLCETAIPAVAAEQLAKFCDVFCEQDVFTAAESERILTAGRAAGLEPKIHADELTLSGGSRVAADVHAVSADHLMMIDDDGIERLKTANVVPTLLPGTTFFLGKQTYAPAGKMLSAGLQIALATDRNPGSCTIESLQFICGLACLRMGLTPEQALEAATAHGARALGLSATHGRIVAGQRADLILWDAPAPAHVVYEFENILPRTVFVAGKPVFGMQPERRN